MDHWQTIPGFTAALGKTIGRRLNPNTPLADTPDRLFLKVHEGVQQCNALTERLLGISEFFFFPNSLVRLRLPTLAEAELTFIRTVSWLYVQFIEAGSINVGFARARFATYGIHTQQDRFLDILQLLRTYHQHNLDYESARDARLSSACESWFRDTCGTAIPSTAAHYQTCTQVLLQAATGLVQDCVSCLRAIEADSESDVVTYEWKLQRARDVPPEEFDNLVAMAANDLGMPQIDPVKVRRKFYDQWRGLLRLVPDGSDIRSEARKLVEHSLLKLNWVVLPITGRDLLDRGVLPGPEVKRLLNLAQKLFDHGVTEREQLLEKLQEHIPRPLA